MLFLRVQINMTKRRINNISQVLQICLTLLFILTPAVFLVVAIIYNKHEAIALAVAAIIVDIILYFAQNNKLPDFILKYKNESEQTCKFALYGIGGTGKTTFISSIIGGYTSQEPTQSYHIYNHEINIGHLENKEQKIKIAIADYQGQRPNDMLLDVPSDWRLSEEQDEQKRIVVDALFFMVDIFSCRDKQKQLNKNESISLLIEDTENKIQKRLEEHNEYINEGILHMLFNTYFHGGKILYVRLLINKIDLIEELILRKAIPDFNSPQSKEELDENVKSYTLKIFEPIKNKIEAACYSNGVNFDVQFISAYDNNNVMPMLVDIVSSIKRDKTIKKQRNRNASKTRRRNE